MRMPTPVIIDTDPGVDDVLAILYALSSPEIEILAILVSYGNTDLEHAYTNIIRLYSALHSHFASNPSEKARFPNIIPRYQKHKTYLAHGPSRPLEGVVHNAQYFHGRDGLGDITTLYPSLFSPSSDSGTSTTSELASSSPSSIPLLSKDQLSEYLTLISQPAPDLTLDLLRSQPPRSITYIALGPLTNLHNTVTKGDGLELFRDRIGKIIIMGGALDVPGNTNPVAEFNFFTDPYAVKDLLISTLKKTENGNEESKPLLPLDRVFLLPLDITTPHELYFPNYTKHVDPSFVRHHTSQQDPVSIKDTKVPPQENVIRRFTSAFLKRTREVMIQFGKDAVELHDIVAVWCAIQNPNISTAIDASGSEGELSRGANLGLQDGWRSRRRIFEIERTGEITRGMLVVDRRSDGMASATTEYSGISSSRGDGKKHNEELLNPKEMKTKDSLLPAPVQVESVEEAQWLDRHHHHHHYGIQEENREKQPEVERSGKEQEMEGVPCIVQTPGSDALVSSMLERIWGIYSLGSVLERRI